MKYFVLADVHSFYDNTIDTLSASGFDIDNKEHRVILCGDMLDRGSKPRETLSFFQNLGDRFYYVRGNHEDLLFDCANEILRCETPSAHHFSNGTVDTICKLCKMTKTQLLRYVYAQSIPPFVTKSIMPILKWIDGKSVDFIELDNYVFVHGWIPTNQNDWRQGDWNAARWAHGSKEWHDGAKLPGKTIVCGHWHCSEANYIYHHDGKNEFDNFSPFMDDGIIALDACTAYSGIVNCLVIEK